MYKTQKYDFPRGIYISARVHTFLERRMFKYEISDIDE